MAKGPRNTNGSVRDRDPERENAVRVAAIVAAGGRPVPEGILNDIVTKATRPGMSIAQSVNEATSAVQQIVNAVPPVNFSAAPQAGQVGLHHHFMGLPGQRPNALALLDDDRTPRTTAADNSSLRFGEMKLTQAQLDAQALALRTPGMAWAANNHDLLRIPGAIQSFIDAKIREESYKAVKSAGFTDRNAVAAAKWALENKKDGNDVFNNIADSVRLFGGNDPAAQQRWRDLFNNLHTDKTGKARKEMDEALRAEDKHVDPARRERAKKTREIYKLEEGVRNDADAEAKKSPEKKAEADANEKKAAGVANELDALLAGAPAHKAEAPVAIPPANPAGPVVTPPSAQQQAGTATPSATTPAPPANPPTPPARQVGAPVATGPKPA